MRALIIIAGAALAVAACHDDGPVSRDVNSNVTYDGETLVRCDDQGCHAVKKNVNDSTPAKPGTARR
jgi:hypothetical protein